MSRAATIGVWGADRLSLVQHPVLRNEVNWRSAWATSRINVAARRRNVGHLVHGSQRLRVVTIPVPGAATLADIVADRATAHRRKEPFAANEFDQLRTLRLVTHGILHLDPQHIGGGIALAMMGAQRRAYHVCGRLYLHDQ